MSTATKILLILLALAILYGYIGRNRRDSRSQGQLLDAMSHEELVDLLINVIPGRPNVPEIEAMSDAELKKWIRHYQAQKNG